MEYDIPVKCFLFVPLEVLSAETILHIKKWQCFLILHRADSVIVVYEPSNQYRLKYLNKYTHMVYLSDTRQEQKHKNLQ